MPRAHGQKVLTGLAALLACLATTPPAPAETSAHRLERKLHKLEKQTGQFIRNVGAAAFEDKPIVPRIDGSSPSGPSLGCLLDDDDLKCLDSKPTRPRSPPPVPRKAN
jgi:hypothetical protein